jgi:hypothetical protein
MTANRQSDHFCASTMHNWCKEQLDKLRELNDEVSGDGLRIAVNDNSGRFFFQFGKYHSDNEHPDQAPFFFQMPAASVDSKPALSALSRSRHTSPPFHLQVHSCSRFIVSSRSS